MQLRSVLLGATLLSAPTVAMAQLPELAPPPPLTGLYIGAGAGANWLLPEHLINPQTGNAANGNLVAQTGFVALGSVGYALPNGLRFEIEGNYRSNKWNHASAWVSQAGPAAMRSRPPPCSTRCTTSPP